MKLNKKGFGVAEMAIVILLIGILAAAVIVGFLGIKKNATEHVKEEATMSIEIIHQTKHAYPTILSKNQQRLIIKNGEYEVYELSGYKIYEGNTGKNALYVEKGGTLFLSGNGTLDDQCKIEAKATGTASAVVNYGNLTLSDVIISGGDKTNKNARYQLVGDADSVTTLNNVKMVGTNGGVNLFNATLYINGVNSNISLPSGTNRSGQNLFYLALASKVEINDGTITVSDMHNKYFGFDAGTLIINGGTFTDNMQSNSACTSIFDVRGFNDAAGNYGDPTYYECNVEINGGTFDCTVCSCSASYAFINFSGKATVTISGGEFKKKPPRFVVGADKDNGKILTITGGTFHFNTTSLGANGWEHYVPKDTHKIVDNGNGTYTVKGINE